MHIIGLSGTNGSGKDTVGLMLVKKHGYLFVSVSDLLRDELKRRGESIDREHLRSLSAEWRREFGYGVLVDRAVELYQKQTDTYEGLVLASLRNPTEVDRVHELGGQVWWIDADPHIRYDRIQDNAHLRGRGGEDRKTFEEFVAEEQVEMQHTGDAATLNMSGVRDSSDIRLDNGDNDLDHLNQKIAELLKTVA